MVIEFEKRILGLCEKLDRLMDEDPKNVVEISKLEARISEARSLFSFYKDQVKQDSTKQQYREG